ncbi:unnamed protein product [Rhizopus microsporus]
MCYTTSSLFLKNPSYSHFNKRKSEKKRYTQRVAECMKSDDCDRSQGTHEKRQGIAKGDKRRPNKTLQLSLVAVYEVVFAFYRNIDLFFYMHTCINNRVNCKIM